jgi:hypothetical protein
MLRLHFEGCDDVDVIGNNFIYYEEGNPNKRVSPDCYVVLGVKEHPQRSYKVWEQEGKYPDLIIEVTSLETKSKDIDFKRRLYERWGVKEYIQFDPLGEYLKPSLQGLRLVKGAYVPIPMQDGHLTSEVLGLNFVAVGNLLRLFDPVRGVLLPLVSEAVKQAEAQRQRAEAAEERERQIQAQLEALMRQREPKNGQTSGEDAG